MSSTPRDPSPDATIALLRDPYRYVSRRARELDTDVFRTRLLLRPTMCMTGRDAAEVFYSDRFVRDGAMPGAIRKTLLGEGGVQGLDGEAHAHRKRMFLSMMGPERLGDLVEAVGAEWRRVARECDQLEVYETAQRVLTRAVCGWAGVPLEDAEVADRTRDLTAMFDGAGAVGLRHLQARRARQRGEAWAAEHVRGARDGDPAPSPGTALHAIAHHRDLDGKLLDEHVAAVELLNVLRPTVAIAVYAVFLVHALGEHPELRDTLRGAPDERLEELALEVRRFYPFFPAAAAVAARDFEWRGHAFRSGTRALLDLHGIDRDPRQWSEPQQFRPERFRNREIDAFEMVPQGGGDHAQDHRCAGEWLTMAVLKRTARFFLDELDYSMPEQDAALRWDRMPPVPKGGLRLEQVRLA